MVEENPLKDQHGVQEDGPEYRSVMMQPLSSRSTERVSGIPPVSNAMSVKVFSKNLNSKKRGLNDPSVSNCRWIVQELRELPEGYVLSAMNVYVKEGTPQQVANRICNAMRSLSITILRSKELDETNALLAESKSGVKFVIRLFRENNMVVIELQRQRGCSLEFREAARTILRCAKGFQQQVSHTTRRFAIPNSLPKRSREVYKNHIHDDIRIACNMLYSAKLDAQILALESMEKLTKDKEAKGIAAKEVLENYECLRHLLFLLDFDKADENSPRERNLNCVPTLRRKILGVIANSCEAISDVQLKEILSKHAYDLKAKAFLSILMRSLEDASIRPHDAFEAVRCLRYLLVSEEVENTIIEMSALDAISSARRTGISSHEGLEQESAKLMVQFQNA